MSQILLSINPEHVENIMNGNKQVEFRKVRCRLDVDKIVIYTTKRKGTHPTLKGDVSLNISAGKVVGEAEVIEIIVDIPERVWEMTSDFAGISKRFYDEYYQNKDKAVAYRLGRVKKYKNPLTLADFGINFAPQSFVYI